MSAPSDLEEALDGSDGSVTAFLEQLVGEPIDAERRGHTSGPAATANALEVAAGHPLIFRSAVLQGRFSGRSYLAAESVLVPSRLPDGVTSRLGSSSDPIGRILAEEGISVRREILGGSDHLPSRLPVDADLDGCLLARTYRLDADGTPLMVIGEWFLATLRGFLPPR